MDLSLNDTQQLIQDSARDFVRGACARDVLLKLDRDPSLVMSTLWKQMSELGWTGMAIPEEHGGTGNSLTDVAVLFEELGCGPVPGPLFSSAVLCARILMDAGNLDAMLSGHVEADEAYVGGVRSGGKRGRGAPGKTVVVGLVERGGAMKAMVASDVRKATLRAIVNENVEKGSVVSTDELASYGLLTGDGYTHGAVKHGKREYAFYDHRQGVNHHVNSVESFWKLFKDSIKSTHIHVSPKYMDRYLGEFTFRANHRDRVNGMFDLLVGAL